MYHTNSNQNRAGVAILIPDKVDLKQITGERGGHYIVIKLDL